MTKVSGVCDKKIFFVNGILPKISEENDGKRWVYLNGDKVCSFLSNDDIYKYISNIGNKLTPYSITIGEGNIHFSTAHFKIIDREKIDDNEL